MKTSENTSTIYKAFVAMQGDMVNVKRNAINPFNDSFYSDLARCLEVIRPVLKKHGFAVVQTADRASLTRPVDHWQGAKDDNWEKAAALTKTMEHLVITTRLVHESGEWFESSISYNADTANAQQLGSLITYLRRYELMAMVGSAPEDDDDDAMQAVQEKAAAKGKDKPKAATAPASTKVTNQNVTMQERMNALPKDLQDLMNKAGCVTTAQRWQLYKEKEGNLDLMRKACLAEIKAKADKAGG